MRNAHGSSARRIFPDEEGTERQGGNTKKKVEAKPAESSPMRRGLKGRDGRPLFPPHGARRIFPDEEGTERLTIPGMVPPVAAPAESSPMRRGLKEDALYALYATSGPAESSPMRRGLKGRDGLEHVEDAGPQNLPR